MADIWAKSITYLLSGAKWHHHLQIAPSLMFVYWLYSIYVSFVPSPFSGSRSIEFTRFPCASLRDLELWPYDLDKLISSYPDRYSYRCVKFGEYCCVEWPVDCRAETIGVDLAGLLKGRMAGAESRSLPSGMGYGKGCFLPSRLWGLGSVVSSLMTAGSGAEPSWSKTNFGVFWRPQNAHFCTFMTKSEGDNLP